MQLNYLILVHTNAVQVERLINALNDDDTNFFIHVDKKADIIIWIPNFYSTKYWGNDNFIKDFSTY